MTPETFGPYRLDTLLGEGGMGQVFRAYDTDQDRVVALKVLPHHLSGDEEYRSRFRREARLAAQLTDPHVVPIHRYGEVDGRLFLEMRLVDGDNLAQVLARTGPLAAGEAVRVIEQVAAALDSAHEAGLVHRDVKPSNVFLARAARPGAPRFAYLGDFGIARAVGGPDRSVRTATGTTIGTLDYMAPERFLGREIDRRADVYSLGCLLHECLTGAKPFPGDELPALMHQHLTVAPPAPSGRPGVPRALDAVVARAMAKEPADRYPTAGDLAAAAHDALAPPRAAPPVPPVPEPGPPPATTRVGGPPGNRPPPPAAATRVPPRAAPPERTHLVGATADPAVAPAAAGGPARPPGGPARDGAAADRLLAAVDLLAAVAVLGTLAGVAVALGLSDAYQDVDTPTGFALVGAAGAVAAAVRLAAGPRFPVAATAAAAAAGVAAFVTLQFLPGYGGELTVPPAVGAVAATAAGLVAVLARVAGRGAGTAPRVGPVAAAVADALAAAAVAWLLLLVFPVVYEDVVDVVPLVVVGALVAGALRWLLTRTWTSVAPALLVAALGAVLTVGMSAAAEPFGDAAVDVPLVLALVCAGLALLLLLPAAARAWGAATRA